LEFLWIANRADRPTLDAGFFPGLAHRSRARSLTALDVPFGKNPLGRIALRAHEQDRDSGTFVPEHDPACLFDDRQRSGFLRL